MKTLLILAASLAGCGVADVGTTAVTAAKLHTQQAQEAQQTMDAVKAKLEAAQQAEEQRLKQAEAAADK